METTTTTSAEQECKSDRPLQVRRTRISLAAILASALTGTAAELFLKVGATDMAGRSTVLPWFGVMGLQSKWVWMGIVFTILSFYFWVRAIRVIRLSIAFTLSNVIHVFVPISCWLILGEAISLKRWLGISLVVVGLAVIARPFAQLDEKLEEVL